MHKGKNSHININKSIKNEEISTYFKTIPCCVTKDFCQPQDQYRMR